MLFLKLLDMQDTEVRRAKDVTLSRIFCSTSAPKLQSLMSCGSRISFSQTLASPGLLLIPGEGRGPASS
ncbi:hypothetical protein GN956_G18911 [Arapaima gigas]